MLSQRIQEAIRDIPDFPQPGIIFKDIMPVLLDPVLCRDITSALHEVLKESDANCICGIESRGFFFGPALAVAAGLPFIPVRKAGKLPGAVIQKKYALEYGSATIEIQKNTLPGNARIFLHDDLLATGGTACAAIDLLESQGAKVVTASFLVNLSFLTGEKAIREKDISMNAMVTF